MAEKPTLVAISLGSNTGDRSGNLKFAIEALHEIADLGYPIQVSYPYETSPVDCPPGSGAFLNAACTFRCPLEPHALLDRLKDIERAAGRPARYEKNSPRQLDLDILVYGDQLIESPRLCVPHPRVRERRFVLEPLCEIAPNLTIPPDGMKVNELLQLMPEADAHSCKRLDTPLQ